MRNVIHNMDCVEGMKNLPDNFVDITITSPPYNAGENVRGNFYQDYSDDLGMDEYYKFIRNVLDQLIRVTKHYVFFNFQILSGNKDAFLRMFKDYRENIKEIIMWHKKQVQPAIQPTCLSSAFEFIVVFAKKDLACKRTFERAFFNNREKGQLNTNIIFGDNMSATKQFNKNNETNKATFPEYLVRELLQKFSDKGDLILDPFMGTGTTAYVARSMGRDFLGYELSEEYVKISQKRLNQYNLADF